MAHVLRRVRSFLRELKRRRVYRVAAIYAGVAFVVSEGASIVIPALRLPDWTLTLVVIVALAGFPAAVVLAWAFELTPEGIQRTRPVGVRKEAQEPDRSPGAPGEERAEAGRAAEAPRIGTGARAAVALAVLAGAGALAYVTFSGVVGRDGTGAGSGVFRSLAVLPLQDLSGGSGQEYFAAGMHDALIGELAQIGALRVISRTSAARYRGTEKPVPEIAEELGVEALVEGSVARTGDSVRIRVQLVGAVPEERQLWTKVYERELRGVLGIYGEVARAVAREIAVALSPEEKARLSAPREVNPRAYEAYLRGMYHLNTFTPEGFERGLEQLNEAIEIDPADPLPWAGLALGWALIGHAPEPPPDALDRAAAAARRALELDPVGASGSARAALAETWEALAEVRLYRDWDWSAAEDAFQRAIALNPSLAPARAHHSWFLLLKGKPEAALSEMERAGEVDPLNPLWPAWRGWILWNLGRHEEGLDEARSSLELNPDFPVGLYVLGGLLASERRFEEAIEAHRRAAEASPAWGWGLGHTYALAGRTEEALEVAARLAEDPTPIRVWGLAQIHAALGRRAEAYRWLERGFELRWNWMPWIGWERAFAPLRDDPRFRELIERLDLPADPADARPSV